MKKRILIPLFYDYYLFEYLKDLIPQLIKDGHTVYFVYGDLHTKKLYSHIEGLKFIKLPHIIRILMNRIRYSAVYTVFWVVGKIWVPYFIRKYRINFSVLPSDIRPLFYIISKTVPSLTVHNTTEHIDFNSTLARDDIKKSEIYKTIWFNFYKFIDLISKGKLFYRVNNQILNFNHRLLIDRMMGRSSKTNYIGFSGITYLTVTGFKIKENLVRSGLKESNIHVVGHPAYDKLTNLRNNFSNKIKDEFLKENNIPKNKDIVTLFLSPSSFSDNQRNEIMRVTRVLVENVSNIFIIIKFHPKTRKEDPSRFQAEISKFTQSFILMTKFKGDYFNAKLMLASEFIVQKQCTLGFMAMLFRVPMISYNITKTDYEDDMYEILDASFHVKSIESLKEAIKKVQDPASLDRLSKLQKIACKKYCLDTVHANEAISKIILDHK
jgi:hypothetical protein